MARRKRDDTDRFVLFPNDRKRPGKKDPDFNGTINIDGIDFWFSAWGTYDSSGGLIRINGAIGDEKEKQSGKEENKS